MSRDPIGEEGGLNLYGYVENRVTVSVDLSGLSPSLGSCAAQCAVEQSILGTFAAVSSLLSVPIPKPWLGIPVVGSRFSNLVSVIAMDRRIRPWVRVPWRLPSPGASGVLLPILQGKPIQILTTRNALRWLGRLNPFGAAILTGLEILQVSSCVIDCLGSSDCGA